MRRPLLSGLASTLLVLPAIVIACSSDAPSGTTPEPEVEAGREGPDASGVPSDAAVVGADAADAKTYPQAKGNPCRGVPLPPDQRFVPAGMCAHVVAWGLGGLRQITFAPNGDLLGVTAGSRIIRFRDDDGDGFFQENEITTYAETEGNGNNVHLDVAGGYIYAGTLDGVKRWPYSAAATTGGAGEAVVTGQPSSGHPYHTVHVYDGYLYVHSGSEANTSDPKSPEYDDDRSLIRRFALSSFVPGQPFAWLSGQVVTVGLRNANGFTRNAAGRIYAVVNGMDGTYYEGQDVHNDNPGEQIVEIAMGKRYGFPYCWTAQRVVLPGGQVVPPGTQLNTSGTHTDAWCATSSSQPTTFVQAHSAPLDIAFFDDHPKGGLPERYRGGAFVALHGSWNRSPATGYKVIWIPFDAAGKAPMPTSTATDTTFPYEVVLGGGTAAGAVDGAWSWAVPGYADEPRFAGVAVSPLDGALYATSDSQGVLYRVGTPN